MLRLLVLTCIVTTVAAHGRLREPPSRASMWRDGFKTPPDYDDDQMYCGGLSHQLSQGGKCGICGDPWDAKEPRPHELGGKYGQGIITRNFTVGQTIDVWVELTTNHGGWFDFRVCPLSNPGPGNDATQECLNKHSLLLEDGTGPRININRNQKDFHLKLKLPGDLSCSHCLLQWDWYCANQWGICPDGQGAMGCGPQETFRGCADISIRAMKESEYKTTS